MPRDPLSTLIRLRQRVLDEAQREVVSCLQVETEAQRLADEADRAIMREMEAASDPSGPDAAVEAFAAWLPGARRRVEEARREWATRQAETTRARANVAACRSALESVQTLQAERREAVAKARDRRQQLELEDRSGAMENSGP